MVWDFQDNRFKALQIEVRQELPLAVHSTLEARHHYEEVKARWQRIWPTVGAEAELYIVDRKDGKLYRIQLPSDAPP